MEQEGNENMGRATGACAKEAGTTVKMIQAQMPNMGRIADFFMGLSFLG